MGHDVAPIDRSTFPSNTLSTYAIARAGVVQLHRCGLLSDVLATGTPAVSSVSFTLPGADPIERTVKTAAGVDLLGTAVVTFWMRCCATRPSPAGATHEIGTPRR